MLDGSELYHPDVSVEDVNKNRENFRQAFEELGEERDQLLEGILMSRMLSGAKGDLIPGLNVIKRSIESYLGKNEEGESISGSGRAQRALQVGALTVAYYALYEHFNGELSPEMFWTAITSKGSSYAGEAVLQKDKIIDLITEVGNKVGQMDFFGKFADAISSLPESNMWRIVDKNA